MEPFVIVIAFVVCLAIVLSIMSTFYGKEEEQVITIIQEEPIVIDESYEDTSSGDFVLTPPIETDEHVEVEEVQTETIQAETEPQTESKP